MCIRDRAISRFEDDCPASVVTEFCREWFRVGIIRIESNRNSHFGLKIESKSIENRNLEIVTSLLKCVYARLSVLNRRCVYSMKCAPVLVNTASTQQKVPVWCRRFDRSSDGWAKNQLGERRLGGLFFGQQTIGRQARTVRRQQIGRLGDIFETVGRNVWKRRNSKLVVQSYDRCVPARLEMKPRAQHWEIRAENWDFEGFGWKKM